MSKSDLLRERAELTARIEVINKALSLLNKTAVRIDTRRNLKNTEKPEWLQVFEDEGLTRYASESAHGGWVSDEDAADLIRLGWSCYESGITVVETPH